MEVQQVSVTLTGRTISEVQTRAAEFLAGTGAGIGTRETNAAVTARTVKPAKRQAAAEEDALDLSADLEIDEELTADDELSFDDEPEVVTPAKTAKKTKVPNEREMQTAGLTYTRAHGKGKDHTLRLLSKALKTKISSISEIKDEKQIIAAYKFLTA